MRELCGELNWAGGKGWELFMWRVISGNSRIFENIKVGFFLVKCILIIFHHCSSEKKSDFHIL